MREPSERFPAMRQSGLWAVIPVKDFQNAKQRLSGVLCENERSALSRAMVEDMLEALMGFAGIRGVLLVSDDPGVEHLAERYGVQALREIGPTPGLNPAVSQAAAVLAERGASHMLVLHGDLPGIQPADLSALVQGLPPAGKDLVRLAPDRLGAGTNGLLCSLPAPIDFHYGEDSLDAHLAACRHNAVPCQVMTLASLELDIDTPPDLQRLQAAVAAGWPVGSRTVAFLAQDFMVARLQRMGFVEPQEIPARLLQRQSGVEHGT